MAVDGVAVKAHLGVKTAQVAFVGDDERVNFEHLAVFFGEQPVKRAHQRHALLHLLAFESEVEGDAAAMELLVAGGGIDREGQDLFRRLFGHFLDIHAAFGRADERDAGCLAVDEQGEVHFRRNARAVFDVDAVDLFARRAGLLGDQRAAQHFLGFLRGLFHGFGDPHAALVACVGFLEFALAAAASVNLRLYHPDRTVEFARGCLCLFRAHHHAAIGNRGAIAAQKRLGLIFVDIHRRTPLWCALPARHCT